MNQRPKDLISARAKKFIPSQLFVTITFTSKAHNNLQGVFPTMIGFVTLGYLFAIGDDAKRWPRVTKPIMVGKTPCKLLCAFEVKVIVTNSWLGINFLALADIRSLGC